MMNERRYYSQEAKIQAQRERTLLVMFTLSVGVGMGTALALLFAPKEGEVIRGDVNDMVQKQVKSIESQVNDLRAKLEDRLASVS